MSRLAPDNTHRLLEFDKILESLASEALSPMASEELRTLRPLDNREIVSLRLLETSEMHALLDRGEHFPLDALPDVRPALKHLTIAGRGLDPRELVDLAMLCTTARGVRIFLEKQREDNPHLCVIASDLVAMPELEQAVAAAISFTDLAVKDTASPALARLRKEIVRAQEAARECLQRIIKTLAGRDMLQEQVITIREGRLVLLLKDEFRHRVPGLVHDESASGRTVFIEPMESVEMNNRLRQLRSAEREEIERILLALSDRFRSRLAHVQLNLEVLVRLDVIHAKARFGRRLDCHAPQIIDAADGARLCLLAARHPLLLLRGGAPGSVVPLDLDLGGDFVTLVLTGPNAGGKTVALKTIGLLSLMATSGLPIPASADSAVPVFRRIFVDIGDRQSIEHDLSTFTSRLARIVEILVDAENPDLVLLDEIGAGTDPDEGAALAVAVLRELTRRRCLTLATTHHGALKTFAHEQPGVRNGSMAFDSETLRPTYRYQPGLPGSSYAFEIASRLGLVHEIIQEARATLGEEKTKVQNLSTELEKQLGEQKQLVEKLRLEELRLAGLSKLYEERAAHLKDHETLLRRQAVEESGQILQRANASIEEAIREIREKEASRESIREAKRKLEHARQQVEEERSRLMERGKVVANGALHPHELEVGMQVWWRAQAAAAVVRQPPDASGRVLLEVGSLKARVPIAELQRFAGEAEKRVRFSGRAAALDASPPRRATGPEIDVRGMRVDEALAAVDKFIDQAILAGWIELRIIHGKGTGALRQSINAFLAKHAHVSALQSAKLGEGDVGVTVVILA